SALAGTANRDYGVIENQNSPYAKLKSVDLKDVRWTEGFWAMRFTQTREVTLPRLWELASDPQAGHAIQNLRIAAGMDKGEFKGTHWQDAWVYKWLESACYVYAVTANADLDRQMDQIIEVIAKAQQRDGYIASQTIARGWPRFQNPSHHELYTMGHLITAACIHHRVMEKNTLLEVACKAADYIYETFKGRDPKLADFPMNPSIIMAGVELYRTTGRTKYLDMANFFIDWRGSRYGNGRRDLWAGAVAKGSDLNQNWRPLRKETEVVGHAVFFTYLYAGAADAYMETGDDTLLSALDRLWNDLVTKKMYVTGGVSPEHHSHPARSFRPGELTIIAGDSIHEGIAAPYELPNDTAYNETCGQIGNLMWNWRMLAITGQARFADIMERNIFNSILSGIDVDGEGWSYTNPLRWNGPEHVLRSNDTHGRSNPGTKMICCPTNLLRTVASWHNYLYSVGPQGLWIHHYGANVFDGSLPSGQKLKLSEKTDYPWDGKIRITIDAVEPVETFSILLRIPGWANSAKVAVNTQTLNVPCEPGSYAAIERKWTVGDVIELDLPMPVRTITADPLVEQTRNHVAVMRGPIVYCLESVDLPPGVRFEDICLPINAEWTIQYRPDLLGGVTVLKTKAAVIEKQTTEDIGAYRQVDNVRRPQAEISMIPYYAWNNRGEPKMTVWLPVAW
ncbi:MAG TPA: beta-L-arabinofuranosidase domain-containing protein, partial [Sedimentisphaerales bacterium]|nr:beta-L-arabinofuranosidase domain-containing protein [Sedimentisphaerales bacterium]